MDKKKIVERLENLLDETRRQYKESGRTDYSAGIYEGAKRALEEALRA